MSKSADRRNELTPQSVLASLKRLSNKATRDGMARYAIPSDKAFGVPVGKIRVLAKQIGKNHELALALWKTGWYEARMIATFLDDPKQVTPAQMDSWVKDFDNWAICDTVCFHLFDKTSHALGKVKLWAKRKNEFEKRAAFALLASVALHNKTINDSAFAPFLPCIEKAATDERNFVKKGVSWALRLIGRRRKTLTKDCVALAKRLSASPNPAARWIGKDALRDILRKIP